MQSLTELNDDELLGILFFIPDAFSFLSLLSTCSRIRDIASPKLSGRWCSFYAHRFHFSEFELSTVHSGLNWRTQLQQRLAKLSLLVHQIGDHPMQLPAPSPSSVVPTSHGSVPSMSVVLSHARVPSDPNLNRSNPQLALEALKSALVFFSDYRAIASASVDRLVEHTRTLLRFVEGNAGSANLGRFRALLHFDGLDIMASALSYIIGLGSVYCEVQRLILGLFFVTEMSADLPSRPARPMGLILPLRHQLVNSGKVENQKLALSLLAKYTQHEETLNNFFPVFDMVAPLAPWLFDNAPPAIACSISILSAIETEEGKRMVRAIPHISERIVDLLSWTSNMSIMSGCLALITALDAKELVSLDVIPTLIRLTRVYYNIGLEGFILMCLLSLEDLIVSPAATPTLTSTDLLSELLSLLKTMGDASRHRHSIKALLAVLRKLFPPHQPENVANAFAKQFRTLSGPLILQELINTMDHTRRVSSAVMIEELTQMTSPTQSSTTAALVMDMEGMGTLEGALIPVHAPGALDHLDIVELLYSTLNAASLDLLEEPLTDLERLEPLVADLLWVPFSIVQHPREANLLHHCLEYLSTLAFALPLSAIHQTHLGNLVLHLLRILDPSCAPTQFLISLNGPQPRPIGSEMLKYCFMISSALIQQTETLHDGSRSFAEALTQYLISKRLTAQQLDPRLFPALISFTIHSVCRNGMDVTSLKTIHHLLSIQLSDIHDSGIALEFAMLEAILWSKCEMTNTTLKVPELIIPQRPLRHWISLQPTIEILENHQPDVALIGLLGLASFVSTPKGRQLITTFITSHQSSIQLAQSRSIANSIFWKRIIDLASLFPDR